ncbi:MAG: DUF4383 domain-containing protein [Patescibacteria group bacterium]
MAKSLATWFGLILVVLGVLGFIPGITNDDKMIFGIFQVDAVHSIVHIVVGALGLWMGMAGMDQAKNYLRIFGVVFALFAIIGFFQTDTILGIMATNMAHTWVYVVLALIFLWGGFAGGGSSMDSMASTGGSSMPPQKPVM